MTAAAQLELAITTIERRRDRLKHRAGELLGGSFLTCTQRERDHKKSLAQAEILEWVLATLQEGGGK